MQTNYRINFKILPTLTQRGSSLPGGGNEVVIIFNREYKFTVQTPHAN